MMELLYAWATKEYLLDLMTFQQIVMYLNYGIDIKYPKPGPKKDGSLVGASAEEIRRRRDALREQYGKNIEGL